MIYYYNEINKEWKSMITLLLLLGNDSLWPTAIDEWNRYKREAKATSY